MDDDKKLDENEELSPEQEQELMEYFARRSQSDDDAGVDEESPEPEALSASDGEELDLKLDHEGASSVKSRRKKRSSKNLGNDLGGDDERALHDESEGKNPHDPGLDDERALHAESENLGLEGEIARSGRKKRPKKQKLADDSSGLEKEESVYAESDNAQFRDEPGLDEENLLDDLGLGDDDGPTLVLEGGPGADGKSDGLMRWDEALTLEGQVEAILFAAPKPYSVQEIGELIQDENGQPEAPEIERVIQNLLRLYRERNGGFRLDHEKGVGFQFRTVPAAAPLMERMFSSRQRPLSRAALETLSIIAYRQPVTRADIEAIRGVDAGSIIKNLLDRELISCVGRKEDSGRPMMFGTSPEFLRVFRINSLDDLPPLAAFQPAPETMAEAESRLELGEEVDVDEFMSDPDQDEPSLSDGLVESAGSGDFADMDDDFQVREHLEWQGDEPIAAAETPRAGARFDAKGFDDDERRQHDSDTEVALPTGPGVAPGSGEDADGGSDFDQRQGRDGTRDPD